MSFVGLCGLLQDLMIPQTAVVSECRVSSSGFSIPGSSTDRGARETPACPQGIFCAEQDQEVLLYRCRCTDPVFKNVVIEIVFKKQNKQKTKKELFLAHFGSS